MKNIAVLFHGKLRDIELQYKNDIAHLVLKHFHNCYSNFNIDYFGHMWSEETIDYSCYSNTMIIEKNSDYTPMITDLYNKCNTKLLNTTISQRTDFVQSTMFAQISKLISIGKVIDLFKVSSAKTQKVYEYVILFRYDYIVFETIPVPISIDEDTFYLNKHGPHVTSGESVFIVSPNKLDYFKDLLKDIIEGDLFPICHFTYYNYFVNIKKMKYEILQYDVGVNCEQVTLLHQYYNSKPALQRYLQNHKHLLQLTR